MGVRMAHAFYEGKQECMCDFFVFFRPCNMNCWRLMPEPRLPSLGAPSFTTESAPLPLACSDAFVASKPGIYEEVLSVITDALPTLSINPADLGTLGATSNAVCNTTPATPTPPGGAAGVLAASLAAAALPVLAMLF
jgi:hypothetical protein